MIIDYGGFSFVIDKEIDFIMLNQCYENGCNCHNCMEREFDGCPIDEVDIDTILRSVND